MVISIEVKKEIAQSDLLVSARDNLSVQRHLLT